MIFCLYFSQIMSYKCMISYDEGPTKNINRVIEKGVSLNIPLVFYLDPFNPLFDKQVVEEIIENGYEVGMSIIEEVTDETITMVLEKYEKEFIKRTGHKAVLLRLPAVGCITHKTINIPESLGYLIDIPNIDSEDDQKSNIYPFLCQALAAENRKGVSIVFRERYEKSIDILQYVANAMNQKGYKIVPACVYLGKSTSLIKVNDEIKEQESKTKTVTVTKFEVLRCSSPYKIRVFTLQNDDEIKEILVPYSTYNKLYVRDILRKQPENDQELENLYEKIIKECGIITEDDEIKACRKNGCTSRDIGLLCLLYFVCL